MKKLYFTPLVALLLFFTIAFKAPNTENIIGTYGVGEDDPSQIELVLNEDRTYTYQDFSRSSEKIQISGKWELKNNNTVILINDTDISFHQKWKISDDGKTAKSRNRLSFYTLRK